MVWTFVEHVVLGDHRVAVSSRAQLADAMAADCLQAKLNSGQRRPRLVFDVNGHGVSLSRTNQSYRDALDKADIVHADGGFLVTASRWFCDKPIAERSATTDLLHDFAQRASDEGLSFFLLGGTEEVNLECACELKRLYPKLNISGRRNGFFSPDDEDSIVSSINEAMPDIIWVGLGKPIEQIFSIRHAPALKAGWIVTCGGCFNYVTGHYRRAPKWMQEVGLEWLHRVITNPRKLLWRYLVTSPHAIWILLMSSTQPARRPQAQTGDGDR